MNKLDSSQASTAKVNLSEVYPVLREILEAGGSFTLTVTGTSMYPTILGGRDQVTLAPVKQPLKRGDLPFYRRDNGQFILHRIVAVEPDGTYTCCGDHQWERERGIRPDQVIAVAESFCRKGKSFPADSKAYRRWVRFWVRVLPCRRVLIPALHAFAKLRPAGERFRK